MPASLEENGPLSADEIRDLAYLLAENIDLPDNETASHPAWNAAGELHRRGGRDALDLSRAWRDGSPKQRRAAAWILGQLGYSDRPFVDERFAMLASEMCEAANPAVLNDICMAFGHLHDARAIPLVLPLARHQSDLFASGSSSPCPATRTRMRLPD